MEKANVPVHTVTSLTNAHLAGQLDLIKLDLAGPNGPECEVFITAANLQRLVLSLQLVQQRWAGAASPGDQTTQ